jgi:hypothetical protein
MTESILAQAEAAWLNTSIECLEKTGRALDKGSFIVGFVTGATRTREEILSKLDELD